MRTTLVQINCDNCRKHVVEGQEVPVHFEMNGNAFTSDWCVECATALQQQLNPDNPELTCSCGYVPPSGTKQGLEVHKRRSGHA